MPVLIPAAPQVPMSTPGISIVAPQAASAPPTPPTTDVHSSPTASSR